MKKFIPNSKFTCFSITYAVIIISTSLCLAKEVKMDTNVPMGWCIVPDGLRSSMDGITGGNNGRVVRASSRADLANLCMSEEPLVILAEGDYNYIVLGPNKTLFGKAQIGGGPGSSATSIGVGSNNIIRNFNIKGGSGGDGLQIKSKSHVWIDHCTFYHAGDEQVSVTYGSDKITFSWCKFTDKQIKVMLVNNGKPNNAEKTRNNLTLAHCFFDGTDQRNPRIGYGKCHVLNCYYKDVGNISTDPGFDYPGYGIHVYWGAQATVERCNFVNTKDAVSHHKDAKGDGHLFYIENKFDEVSKYAPAETNPDKIFVTSKYYMHGWSVIDAEQVPDVVGTRAGVGAEFGKIGLIPTPGQGQVNVSKNPTLKWTKLGSRAANTVYFGKTFPPPKAKTVDGNSFQPGALEEGTIYFWKINDNDVWVFRTEGEVREGMKDVVLTKGSEPTSVTPFVSINSNPEGLALYLNPAHSEMKIKMNDNYSGADMRDLILYDCLGKTIRKETTSGNEHTMYVKTLPHGIYYISLTGKQGNIYRKFIKN